MIAGVADTHKALWYLFGDSRLSIRAKEFIDQAAASRRFIEVSPISLTEIVYFVEKSGFRHRLARPSNRCKSGTIR